MAKIHDSHERSLSEAEYREGFARLNSKFDVAQVRIGAGLTQVGVVQQMSTTQSAIARLERVKGKQSTSTLE